MAAVTAIQVAAAETWTSSPVRYRAKSPGRRPGLFCVQVHVHVARWIRQELSTSIGQRTAPVTISIRPIEPRDQPRWRELWDAYTRFYQREPLEALTASTWERIFDPGVPVHAIVAEGSDGNVVGIANYLVHESTSALRPVCYLQDLFVDPASRTGGVGGRLIDWLVAEMAVQGWSRLYWHTKEDNYRARGLYDKYNRQSGFLRYVIENSPPS